MLSNYSFLLKYIIIGDASVGKSCVLMQFLQGKFNANSQTTVGVEFGSKIIDVGTQRIKMQIWDTAGQETFKSITRSYYRGSIGAVLVYDVTSRQSFNNLARWLDQTKTYSNEKLSMILVGNKTDLDQKRAVSQKEGRDFARVNNMLFAECSAKDSQKTHLVFTMLAQQILRKINCKEIDPKNQSIGVKIGTYRSNKIQNQTKPTCC